MINRTPGRRARSLEVALLGIFLVTWGVTTYPIVSAWNLTQSVRSGGLMESYAYLVLSLILIGLTLLFYGATSALAQWSKGEKSKEPSSMLSTVSAVFAERRYSRIFLISSIAYGVLYAISSGIIVFQPNIDFSEVYHVGIPSFAVATCCGPVGEMPEAVVYATQHLGLLLVPINALLLFSVSWLVGLNSSLAAFTLSFRRRNIGLGWFAGVGSLIGLFTSCPTCAGLAIIALLGGTGTLSVAFFLGPFQTLFVGLSILILIATPILSARSLQNLEVRACQRAQII
jgi:hypothetical protein